jgi:hypothetical protein
VSIRFFKNILGKASMSDTKGLMSDTEASPKADKTCGASFIAQPTL